MRESKRTKEELDAINRRFNDAVASVLGEDARNDQLPMRDRMGKIPFGGIIILVDPGDLEPVRYPKLSPEDEAKMGAIALKVAKEMLENDPGDLD